MVVMGIAVFLAGCSTNYQLTTFYVRNNTDRTVNFKASILKYGTMGSFEMTLPFTVLPHDSVLARRANFRKDISPAGWFTRFTIFPVDNLVFNDPNDNGMWVRSTDAKGKPVYTFNLARQ